MTSSITNTHDMMCICPECVKLKGGTPSQFLGNSDSPYSPVTVYEDWNERDGKIYYRWKVANGEWNERLTPHKEKPMGYVKYMSKFEFDEFYRRQQELQSLKQIPESQYIDSKNKA